MTGPYIVEVYAHDEQVPAKSVTLTTFSAAFREALSQVLNQEPLLVHIALPKLGAIQGQSAPSIKHATVPAADMSMAAKGDV